MVCSRIRSVPTRRLAVLLMLAHFTSAARVHTGAPAVAQSVPGGSWPEIVVNRTVPEVTPPPARLTLSDAPSADEIIRARVFAEPLVPVGGEPTAEDTAALASALTAFYGRVDRGSIDALAIYLTNFPESPWRASLLANLGALYRTSGAFGRAMEVWDEAWRLAKDRTDPLGRAVADYAISHWLEVAASFGQTEVVQKTIEDLADRDLHGSAATRVAQAGETAALIATYPDLVIASGPDALRVLLEREQGTLAALPPPLAQYQATAAGTSLTELAGLARAVGLPLRPARWTGAGDVPVPSVMHWKLGHFSPIVDRRGDQYLIVDQALDGMVWVSRSTLASETSGYFLVPDGTSETQWLSVTDADAAAVIGHSCVPGAARTPPPMVGGGGANPPTGGGSAYPPMVGGGGNPRHPPKEPAKEPCPKNPGMCGYVLEPSSVSLQLIDTPLRYTPPRGPAVAFRLTYQQRDILQPQIFTYAHVGPKWSFDWQRFLKEQPAQQICFDVCDPAHVWVSRAGGREVYFDPNADGTYDAHWESRAIVVRVSTSPLRYERRLRDGSVEVYGLPDGGPAGEQRVFLTSLIDPQGQALQFTWDAQFRLVAVTDAIGQVTTLTYGDSGDPLRLTRVTDPFGRSATLTYTAAGQLASITDVIGITSSFSYAAKDFVARLTTPYGTTAFRHEADWTNLVHVRMIEATDPLGETEHLEFEFRTMSLPATVPASEVPAGFEAANRVLDRYNTFYWDKRAWKAAPADKTQAVVTHWLLKSEFPLRQDRLAVPHSVKPPLEGRVWYMYPGQVTTLDRVGWWIEPERVGRRLDDGSSQVWTYTYDTYGNVLTATEPLGRRTSYIYAANGVDLLEVRQTTGTQNDLLASFSNYTAQHRSQTMVDAAGQTTTVTYNSAGQPLTVTNPKLETTTYAYDPNGYLTSVTGPVTGATTTYTYDGYGRVRTVTNSDNYTTTTDYDSFDRATRITYPGGTYEAFTYDRLDIATTRDRLGRITRVYHDALRRVLGVRDPLGPTVQQTWGPDDVVDKLIDGKRQATSWEYDVQGRVTREVRANGSATVYTYEPLGGRLKTVTDPKNQVKTYAYALDDALASVVYTNAAIPTPSVSYTYDTIYPRLATMVDGLGTTAYTYRPVGQLGATRIASIDGPRTNDTLTYTYDELGRMTNRALNAVGITWAYDALGRLTSEVNPLGTFTYTYDGVSSRLATATYPNNQTSVYSYFGNTGDGRLQTLHHKTPDGATLSKFDYTYDVVGNVLSWQQQADAAAPVQWTYGYDLADQLVAAVKKTTDPTPVVLKRYGYVYDAAGNRTTEQIDDAVTGVTVDNVNRLVSHQPAGIINIAGTLNEPAAVTINGKAAAVDATNKFSGTEAITAGANEFTVVATDPAGNSRTQIYDLTSSGSTKTFTHDANGNMTGDGTRTFEWDAENRLVAVNSGTHRSEFTYDGYDRRVRIVEKEGGTTTRDAELFWAGTVIIEERLTTGEMNRFLADGEQHSGSARYLTRDHLGSVRELSGSSASIVARNDYDPFGRITRTSGTEDSRFGFTGHMVHGPTSLVLALYRAYDGTVARWLSQDPIGLQGGLNHYAYVYNAPVRESDLLGLQVTKPPIDQILDAWKDFWHNYQQMRRDGEDQYHHCMANCEASNQGSFGQMTATIISTTRESADFYKNMARGLSPKESLADCRADMRANFQGQNASQAGQSCEAACAPLKRR